MKKVRIDDKEYSFLLLSFSISHLWTFLLVYLNFLLLIYLLPPCFLLSFFLLFCSLKLWSFLLLFFFFLWNSSKSGKHLINFLLIGGRFIFLSLNHLSEIILLFSFLFLFNKFRKISFIFQIIVCLDLETLFLIFLLHFFQSLFDSFFLLHFFILNLLLQVF